MTSKFALDRGAMRAGRARTGLIGLALLVLGTGKPMYSYCSCQWCGFEHLPAGFRPLSPLRPAARPGLGSAAAFRFEGNPSRSLRSLYQHHMMISPPVPPSPPPLPPGATVPAATDLLSGSQLAADIASALSRMELNPANPECMQCECCLGVVGRVSVAGEVRFEGDSGSWLSCSGIAFLARRTESIRFAGADGHVLVSLFLCEAAFAKLPWESKGEAIMAR
jgi:hypothetical protein